MKKIITSVLSALIVLSIALTLTGCGEKSKFVGTWKATIDLSDKINEQLEGEEFSEYIDIKDFKLDMVITFNSDDTYKREITEESAEKALEDLYEAFEEGMEKYLKQMLKDEGIDMTVDELLESQDTSMDDFIDAFKEEVNVESVTKDFNASGKWKVEDGKLYMSDSTSKEVDTSEYEKYEISSSELKLTESSDDDEDLKDLYPLVFTKQ